MASSSSHGRPALKTNGLEKNSYVAGQALVTAVNNPRSDNLKTNWWGFKAVDNSWRDPPPPRDTWKYPDIGRQDLDAYLQIVGNGRCEQFHQDRESLADGLKQQLLVEGEGASLAQGDGLAQALQQVPAQYFREDFSLHTPGVLQALVNYENDEDGVQHGIDKLGGYLDVVESQLMREISCRSKAMFEAAGELHDLHRSLCKTLDQIKAMRSHLSDMDEQTYISALAVSALQRRRTNLVQAVDLLQGMAEVAASRTVLQCLLEGQDYAGSLELLGNLGHMVDRQLSLGIRAFKETRPQVDETLETVESLLALEFLSMAHIQDMHVIIDRAIFDAPEEVQQLMHVSAGSRDMADALSIQRSTGNSPEEEAAAREQLHDKLLPVVIGLYRSNRLSAVLVQMRENMSNEIKALVREVLERMLVPLLEAAEQEGSGSNGGAVAASGSGQSSQSSAIHPAQQEAELAERLAALTHTAFMQVLIVVYRTTESCFRFATQLGQLMEDVLRSTRAQSQYIVQMKKDVAASVQAMADVVQSRWTKLLGARSAPHTRLRLPEFKSLADLCEAMQELPERYGGARGGSGALRTAIQGQGRALLEQVHAKGLNQLQQLLEGEQWTAVEVPGSIQAIVDRLMARCTAKGDDGGSTPSAFEAAAGGSLKEIQGGEHAAASTQLHLLGRKFHVVTSSLILLKLLDEYMVLQETVPLLGSEVAHRAVELMKVFNSQTCQLVLGAGAMRTAGLKSISAKHLAISCQAVHMLAVLLPQLRAGFVAPVTQQRRLLLLPEFDHLMQDLTVHMDEVHSKLVDIMQDRLVLAAKQLVVESDAFKEGKPSGKEAASAAGVEGGPEVSEVIRGLTKQLGTLRSVLSPILQKEEVQFIFGRVASMYSDTLAATMDSLNPRGRGAEWEEWRRVNALFLLHYLKEIPLDPSVASAYLSRLSTFYSKHYGLLSNTVVSGSTRGHATNSPPQQEPVLAQVAPAIYEQPVLASHPEIAKASQDPLPLSQPEPTANSQNPLPLSQPEPTANSKNPLPLSQPEPTANSQDPLPLSQPEPGCASSSGQSLPLTEQQPASNIDLSQRSQLDDPEPALNSDSPYVTLQPESVMACTSNVLHSHTASTSELSAQHLSPETVYHASSSERLVLVEASAMGEGPRSEETELPEQRAASLPELKPRDEDRLGAPAQEEATPSFRADPEDLNEPSGSLQGFQDLCAAGLVELGQVEQGGDIRELDKRGQEGNAGVSNRIPSQVNKHETELHHERKDTIILSREQQPEASSQQVASHRHDCTESSETREAPTSEHPMLVPVHDDEEQEETTRGSEGGSTCGTVIIKSEYSTDMSRSHSELRFSSSVRLDGDSD
ncbi:hypothetical protein CEUSTIGMA_g595.t1 [Chlamydomonas eustigma]|uniref:Vacuolar protein sorting-associated protein 54 n=1 Tax=Chlamydomonas eustigma TaxID=1157962 RepID=A0A250WR44_9CHLO|nr:hypothetical protein CEUSTIGMA_g595.t1 [Chlamydomonas eustigma]|eukprot:GAX73142.1 hypothetical protein CEUSTIGMA_g595.t1 [Chlamydomonas eustigma]